MSRTALVTVTGIAALSIACASPSMQLRLEGQASGVGVQRAHEVAVQKLKELGYTIQATRPEFGHVSATRDADVPDGHFRHELDVDITEEERGFSFSVQARNVSLLADGEVEGRVDPRPELVKEAEALRATLNHLAYPPRR